MSQHDTLTLREALRSIQYEAASLADAQVIALQALNATYPARAALSATQPAQAAQSVPGVNKAVQLIPGMTKEQFAYVHHCALEVDAAKAETARLLAENAALKAQAAQGGHDHDKAAAMVSWVAHSLGYLRERLSSSHDVDSLNRSIGELYQAHALLKQPPAQPAAAQGAGEVVPYAYAVYFPDQPTEMLVHDLDDLCEDMTNREHTVTQLYTQPAAGADVLDAVMYLLQDTRSYVCNCVVWRAKDGNGYTTDVAKAHRYTFDEAMRQHRSRDTDLPWPCDEVLPLARGHVDVQDVHKIRSLDDQRAAIAASGRQE